MGYVLTAAVLVLTALPSHCTDHPKAALKMCFSSMKPDDVEAVDEMRALVESMKAGRLANAELDLRTGGGICHGVKYCISSMPGEETRGGKQHSQSRQRRCVVCCRDDCDFPYMSCERAF